MLYLATVVVQLGTGSIVVVFASLLATVSSSSSLPDTSTVAGEGATQEYTRTSQHMMVGFVAIVLCQLTILLKVLKQYTGHRGMIYRTRGETGTRKLRYADIPTARKDDLLEDCSTDAYVLASSLGRYCSRANKNESTPTQKT